MTFGVYAVAITWFFWRIQAFVWESDWLLLALCVVLLATGGVVNQLGDLRHLHYTTLEKGFELLGVTAWTLYVARSSLRYLTVAEDGTTPRD